MSADEKRIVLVTAGVLVVLWLLKKGGLGLAFQAGPFSAGAGLGVTGGSSAAGGGGGGAASTSPASAGGCCGCAPPPTGPIIGDFGDFSAGGHTLRVPASWFDDPQGSSYPGWINVGVGAQS